MADSPRVDEVQKATVSRAFVKEDVDPPERSSRTRTASGLPPGATNYITARGARRLRQELEQLRRANAPGAAELENILSSVTIVERPDEPSESVAFGASVTLEDQAGETQTYSVVGVDE